MLLALQNLVNLRVSAPIALVGVGAGAQTGVVLANGAAVALLASLPASVLAGTLQAWGGGPRYPDPAQVLAGVAYGPTGFEFVGTYTDPIRFELESGRLVKPIGSKLALLL